jgi:hypothetical protein
MFALRIVRSFGCVAPQARSQMSGTTRRPCSFLALGVQRARRAALVRRKGFGEGVQNDLPQEQGVAGGGVRNDAPSVPLMAPSESGVRGSAPTNDSPSGFQRKLRGLISE